jgi:hypothetical protein
MDFRSSDLPWNNGSAMLFTIQAYLEEYFSKRNLVDSDGYAVRLANLYFYRRSSMDASQFLRKVKRIRTVLFVNNGIMNRAEFERMLISRLDSQFKKKLETNKSSFPGGTELERKKLQRLPRITIGALLKEFKHAVEARAIDAYWVSRKRGDLRPKPEKIVQTQFALFTWGVLYNRPGIILREVSSGIGFVDIGVVFSSTLHLVEIKVLTGQFTGAEQLEQYMITEGRNEGSLLIVDALEPGNKLDLPSLIDTSSGTIKVYRVDINPPCPSSLS